MKKNYYSEEELIEKVQSGEMNMLDYVTHHSREWDEDYAEYCLSRQLDPKEEHSAVSFLQELDARLTKGIDEGNL